MICTGSQNDEIPPYDTQTTKTERIKTYLDTRP